jgi:hypothetical protein
MLASRLPTKVESRPDEPAQAAKCPPSFYLCGARIEHLDAPEDLYPAEQTGKIIGALSCPFAYA